MIRSVVSSPAPCRLLAPAVIALGLMASAARAEPSIVIATPANTVQAQAPHNCTCRAKGADYAIGTLVCLKTPNGVSMARCEMVLNNTSWTFLNTPCPQS